MLSSKDIDVKHDANSTAHASSMLIQPSLYAELKAVASYNSSGYEYILQHFLQFGRPIWRSVTEDPIGFACLKLGHGVTGLPDDPEILEDRWLACLAATCCLELSPSLSLATNLAKSLLGTLINTDLLYSPLLIVSFVSEPILAIAANEVLSKRALRAYL
jgi:hypothetical protein